jgi:hypothetical protein
MDDEDDEEDEYLEEEEEEGSDDDEGWGAGPGGEAGLGLELLEAGGPMEQPGLDDLPALMMPNLAGFGRVGRRAMYRPASASAAAAGVWDDMEGGEGGQDALLSGGECVRLGGWGCRVQGAAGSREVRGLYAGGLLC